MTLIIQILIAMNVIAAFAMWLDKTRAGSRKSRIPESTLLLLTVLFGSGGILFGMRAFHHKTRKKRFKYTVPICFAVQVILLVVLFYYFGEFLMA